MILKRRNFALRIEAVNNEPFVFGSLHLLVLQRLSNAKFDFEFGTRLTLSVQQLE